MMSDERPTRMQLALGFLCIYTVWGSTYLAIRIAVTTIPPFLMGGVRFIIAGTLLCGWARARGKTESDREQWKNAFVVGGLLLLVGNGAVAWSEQRVSSSMTSLLVATVPLWLVVVELKNGRRPKVLQWIGIVIGLIGVGMLVMPRDGANSSISPQGALVLTGGTLAWTFGSLFSRTARLAKPATMATGMQMLAGGLLLLCASAITGEWTQFHPALVTRASLLALLYLIVFGSLLGFSTYMWLLRVANPAAVGTYAYVNPVVAVLLGVVIGGESLPASAIAAMLIIISSVALVSLAPFLRSRTVEAV